MTSLVPENYASADVTEWMLSRFDSPNKDSVLPESLRSGFLWLEGDISRASVQSQALSKLDLPSPCLMSDGELLPCDVLSLLRVGRDWIQEALENGSPQESVLQRGLQQDAKLVDALVHSSRGEADGLLDAWRRSAEASHLNFVPAKPEQVRAALRSRIGRFLDSGGGGSGHMPPNLPPAGGAPSLSGARPTVAFTVVTKASGLRVHYSPYDLARQDWVFGNTLTTPVTSQLTSGIWKFGVWRAKSKAVEFDGGSWRVPGSTTAQLKIA